MLSSHTVGFQRPDNSNLANLTPGTAVIRSQCVLRSTRHSDLNTFLQSTHIDSTTVLIRDDSGDP